MTTRLLIARHGNTFAPGDIIRRVGATDLPLVASGLEQGRALGNYLQQHHLIPDVIFTSKLQRTMQTAQQAQQAMDTNIAIEALDIFNEIDYGPDENQAEELVIERLGNDALQAWETEAKVPQDWNVNPQDIINNWHAFAKELCRNYAGKTCLVITSNGIARFAPYLTGDFASFTKQYKIKIATGALCIFANEASSAVWECIAWNITPPKQLK